MNTETRPTVWIVKEQVTRGATGPVPMDYTPAYKYGDVKFITECDIPLIRGASTLKDQWKQTVQKFWVEYDPDKDWIVLTGSPLAIFVLGLILGMGLTVGNEAPKVLVWRRETNEYIPFNTDDILADKE